MSLNPNRRIYQHLLIAALLLLLILVYWQVRVLSTRQTVQMLASSASSSTHQAATPVKTRSYYINLAWKDAQAVGISASIFVRQMTEESNFNPHAISPAGAIGIAQFMPATAAGLGLNPRDPVASLKVAAQLMSRYLKKYGGSYAAALAAYNAGPSRLQQAFRCGASWVACLPEETRSYIAIILDQAMASPGGMQ